MRKLKYDKELMWFSSVWSFIPHPTTTHTHSHTRGKGVVLYSQSLHCPLGGLQCPNASALQDVRSCNEHPCTVHHWQTGSWGQCIEDSSIPATNTSAGRLRGDDASCSVGMQTRKVICVRVNVGQVPPKKYVLLWLCFCFNFDNTAHVSLC